MINTYVLYIILRHCALTSQGSSAPSAGTCIHLACNRGEIFNQISVKKNKKISSGCSLISYHTCNLLCFQNKHDKHATPYTLAAVLSLSIFRK